MLRLRSFVLAVCLLVPGVATAGYTSLYVFGDSLMDNGNAYILSEGLATPSPPYAQRYSNGPVAVEYLAAHLGIELAPSAAGTGGTNYAVGGATTGTQNVAYEIGAPVALPDTMDNTGLAVQVASFLGSGPAFNPGKSLFMVGGGANDIFLGLERGYDMETVVGLAVGNLASAVLNLAAAGASNFLIPNIPDLGLIPFGMMQTKEDQGLLQVLSAAFNGALSETLGVLRAQLSTLIPGFTLLEYDLAAFQYAILQDPAKYGFTNVTDACLASAMPIGGEPALPDCNGYLYFDAIHPTSAAHAFLAAGYIQLVPEPGTLMLLCIALLVMLLFRRGPNRTAGARAIR